MMLMFMQRTPVFSSLRNFIECIFFLIEKRSLCLRHKHSSDSSRPMLVIHLSMNWLQFINIFFQKNLN